MKKIKFKILLPLLILLAACENYVTDFKLRDTQIKLVINGMVSPDSIIIQLTKSMKINEFIYYYPTEQGLSHVNIDNAIVKLFENGTEIGNLLYKEKTISSEQEYDNYSYTLGYYTLNGFIPKEGATYRIEAEADGYPKVYASAAIPIIPESIKIDTLSRVHNSFERSGIFEFIPEIINNNGRKNYYAFSIPNQLFQYEYLRDCYFNTFSKAQIEFQSNWGYFSIPNDMFEEEYYSAQYYFVSDKGLSSEPLCLNFFIEKIWLDYIDGDSFELKIDFLDEGYYNHLLSLARWNSSAGIEFFSEGVSIYSNVVNGLGVFGAKNSYRYKLCDIK
ncbi:MAG: DUF4249 domain-containing protein [Marinilabiliaceae bacterium]|nr:DUF4249 domain-containing protein [Marinilabiliaceae bacterium]